MNDTVDIPADIDATGLVAKVTGTPAGDLSTDSNISNTPGWDSFSQVEIMIFLAEHHGIEINEDTIAKYSELSQIKALINAS